MQNYVSVCDGEERVWFEIKQGESEEFLTWAKNLGCKWLNGAEINPKTDGGYFHYSIHNDGCLACISMFAWVADEFKGIKKYHFSDFKVGKKVPITTLPKTIFKIVG